MILPRGVWLVLLTAMLAPPIVCAETADDLRSSVIGTLRKATVYFHTQVATHGGYGYHTSLDLKLRWGEGKASPDTIFVQPPGTPTVGMAYLKAYAATGDRVHLEAARAAAEALVFGQLQSGGWTQVIHFSGSERMGKYRNGQGGKWNASSLDDGQTQTALQFLMRADQALEFKHPQIHDSALFGLTALLNAQFPNGAFPQVWTQPVNPHPIVKARYPDYDWRTEGRVKNYWDCYTLNDGLAGTVCETLITAHEVYRDDKYKSALLKLGDFLVLAQMPDPQPAWCQQYGYDMVPIWARKFEPPAVTAWESQDVIETLIRIATYTQQKKYLEPIPKALTYLKKSVLPNGQVARYRELKSNKPLYMDSQYRLTYDDSDVPKHYGWKQDARLEQLAAQYQNARDGATAKTNRDSKRLEAEAKRIIRALDAEGRWVAAFAGERLVGQPKFAQGFQYLSSETFSQNVETLCEYLEATKPR